MRRFAGPGITALFTLGLQISGFQSPILATVMWLVAILWGTVALVTFEPVRQKLPQWDFPWVFRSPVTRKYPPRTVPPPLGFLDHEATVGREGTRLTKTLGDMAGLMANATTFIERATDQTARAADKDTSAKIRVVTGFSVRLRRHAYKMSLCESRMQQSMVAFSTSVGARVTYLEPGSELADLRDRLSGLVGATASMKSSVADNRHSVAILRSTDVHHTLNESVDYYLSVLDLVLDDVVTYQQSLTAVLRSIDDKLRSAKKDPAPGEAAATSA